MILGLWIWRQQDATRNAIQMAGREHFSHKELNGVNCNQIQEMLFQKHGINFDKYPTVRKRGFCIIQKRLESSTKEFDYLKETKIDLIIPIFSKDRNYVENMYLLEKINAYIKF